MAYTKYDAILERVRELLEDGYGSIRAISSSRFQGGLHDGLPNETLPRLGELSQKPIEASITGVSRHPQRLTIVGDVQIERFTLEVRVVRALATPTQVNDALRDDVKALAVEDSDVIKQALEWPANLTSTQGGTTTDCKALIFDNSRPRVRVNKTGAAMFVDTIHTFTGTAVSRPATS